MDQVAPETSPVHPPPPTPRPCSVPLLLLFLCLISSWETHAWDLSLLP